MRIKTVEDLDGVLGSSGYPFFFITDDGGVLSEEAVEANREEIDEAIRTKDSTGGWRVVGVEINYEDDALYCDHTGERIQSAYAEGDTE